MDEFTQKEKKREVLIHILLVIKNNEIFQLYTNKFYIQMPCHVLPKLTHEEIDFLNSSTFRW